MQCKRYKIIADGDKWTPISFVGPDVVVVDADTRGSEKLTCFTKCFRLLDALSVILTSASANRRVYIELVVTSRMADRRGSEDCHLSPPTVATDNCRLLEARRNASLLCIVPRGRSSVDFLTLFFFLYNCRSFNLAPRCFICERGKYHKIALVVYWRYISLFEAAARSCFLFQGAACKFF